MELILALVKSGTFRRLVVFIVALAVTALNRRFGLDLSPEEIAAAVVLALTYLLQSATKEAVVKRAEAAGQKAAGELAPEGVAGVVKVHSGEYK